MAEVQRSTNIGEMSQRFIEFILMQAENAALMLGLRPHPATGRPEKNLEMARIFIDQLEMIREKTRGNLTAEETKVLTKMLGDLQFAYVRVSGDITAYDSATMPKDENDRRRRNWTRRDCRPSHPRPPRARQLRPQANRLRGPARRRRERARNGKQEALHQELRLRNSNFETAKLEVSHNIFRSDGRAYDVAQ